MGPPNPPTYPTGSPYVTPAQLPQYLPAAALNLATSSQQAQACLDATETLDGALRGRYGNGTGQPFFIQAWGNDIVRYTAAIAIYFLMDGPIGWAAQAGGDRNIKAGYFRVVGGVDPETGVDYGIGVMGQIQRQALHPDVTPMVPIGQNPNADVPQVFTSPQRGWTNRLRNPQRIG